MHDDKLQDFEQCKLNTHNCQTYLLVWRCEKKGYGIERVHFPLGMLRDKRRTIPSKRIISRLQKEFAIDGQMYQRCNAGSDMLDSALVTAMQAWANGVIIFKLNMVVVGILIV